MKYFSLFLFILLLSPSIILAQSDAPCTSPESSDLDYMLGHWYGMQYIYENGDTTAVGTTELEVSKNLDGCVNKEIMDVHSISGEHLFNGVVFRSYDADKGEWRFTEVDDRGGHYFFTSKKENGIWYFYDIDTRVRDGREYKFRLSYPKVNDKHFKQIFARSFDGGKTWVQASHIDFYRDKPHPK